MLLSELVDKIEKDPDLEGVGIENTDKGTMLLIKHLKAGMVTRIPLDAVSKLDWELLLSVLNGTREPVVLQHMTRVVGYYSRTENWNRSKLGELKDRQKGNYAVAEHA